MLPKPRHEAMNGGAFKPTRARHVGHDHAAASNGLQQTGDTQMRIFTQFKRIQPLVVGSADQTVNGFQPVDCFQEHLVVANGQVVALHQRDTQITRKVGVLKIGFVKRARR